MKKKIQFRIGSPVTLIILAVSAAILILDSFVLKGKATQTLFSCPAAKGNEIFRFTLPINYFRMIFHPLGQSGFMIFFAQSLLALSLGRQIEETYGATILLLMLIFSALVSGVLNAAFGNCTIQGLSPLIFTMILISLNGAQNKGTIYFSSTILLLLYLVFQGYLSFISKESYVDPEAGKFTNMLYQFMPVLISFAGGAAGSLFGFLCGKGQARKNKESWKDRDTTEATL